MSRQSHPRSPALDQKAKGAPPGGAGLYCPVLPGGQVEMPRGHTESTQKASGGLSVTLVMQPVGANTPIYWRQILLGSHSLPSLAESQLQGQASFLGANSVVSLAPPRPRLRWLPNASFRRQLSQHFLQQENCPCHPGQGA